jgi:hypothetical protein
MLKMFEKAYDLLEQNYTFSWLGCERNFLQQPPDVTSLCIADNKITLCSAIDEIVSGIGNTFLVL